MGFKDVLSGAGRAFIIAFGSSALLLSTGVLAATDTATAMALGIGALFASVSAGVKAVQMFVPMLSWAKLLPQPFAAWADAFTQGFLGAFSVSLIGWLDAGDVTDYKAWVVGALVGAVMAGLRLLQGVATPGEAPFTAKGIGGV